jgi:hypothetical protein
MGPDILGPGIQDLGRLALRPRRRETGDRRASPPPKLQVVLALEIKSKDIAAIDFFTVPTATFRVLFCFLVLRHDRRRVVHFNDTENL